MKMLKALFYSIAKSVSSVNYYKDLEFVKTSFSYKYFLGLSLILSLALTLRFVFIESKLITQTLNEASQVAKSMFEKDLVLGMNETGWTINKPEPYAINVNLKFPDGEVSLDRKHFIVFDHNGTLDQYEDYDTYFLINAKNIISKENNGFTVTPIDSYSLPQGQITKADFDGLIDMALSYTKWLPAAGSVLWFIGWMMFFVLLKGGNLFVAALPVWLLGMTLGYKESYKYSDGLKVVIHASTLPLILYTLTKLAGYDVLNQRFFIWVEVATLVIALFVVWMLSRMEKIKKSAEPAVAGQAANPDQAN